MSIGLIMVVVRSRHMLNERPDPLTLSAPLPGPSESGRFPSIVSRGKVAGDNVEKDPKEGSECIDKESDNEQQRCKDDVHDTENDSEDRRGNDPT